MEIPFYWILLALIAAYVQQDSLQIEQLTLSSSNEVVQENSSVNLTCSHNNKELNSSIWTTSLYDGKHAQCKLQNNSCIETLFLSNTTLYNCICNDDGSFTVQLKHVDRYQHGSNWTCRTAFFFSNSVLINVSVPVMDTTLTRSGRKPMYENTTVTFNCTSYSLPAALIDWYRTYNSTAVNITDSRDVDIKHETQTRDDNVIRVTEILSYSVNRSVNGWSVYCVATYSQRNEVTSNQIELSVIYPPDRPPVIHGFSNGGTYKVIENDKASLFCSVNGGNPLAKLEWYCEGINNITTIVKSTNTETVNCSLSWFAKHTDGKTCTCKASHVLSNVSIHVNIDVLYPPGIPTIGLKYQKEWKNVTSYAKLIEHKTYQLLCMADANPPPSEYTWDGPQTPGISNNASIDLHGVNRTQNGTYICNARNTMHPTNGDVCTKENKNNVNIEILFKPTVAVINKQDIAEGSSVNVTCEAISANPSNLTFTWTSDTVNDKRNSEELVLQNLSRHDAMSYTCTVKNYMKPTVGEDEEGCASETFYLNVWYRASVKRFVVNSNEHDVPKETDNITFTCEIDSNPDSIVKIITPNGTEIISNGTNVFEYNHFLSSCLDSGTYTCSGSNDYNYGHPGLAKRSLLIKCTPMAYHHIDKDVRSKLYVPVTFTFRALAYPEPEFTWEKWENWSWNKITNDGMFSVSSYKLQSNLTVVNFTTTTAIVYRLIAENEIGMFLQNYTLKPYDRPGKPTDFNHIKELQTFTSVTLSWKPGFDGGIQQTFVIMYRDEKENIWNTEQIQDTGNTVMNLTVHDLSSDTSYIIQLFAINSVGPSENVTLQIKTKVMEHVIDDRSIVGSVAGSVSGVVVVTVGVVIGILVYRKRSSPEKNSESSKLVYQNVLFTGKGLNKELRVKVPSKKETSFQELQEPDDAPPLNREPTEYYNSPDKLEHIQRIKVSELLPFVLSSSKESFGIEYQKLPTDLQKPCVFARKPENIALNRYNGIYPYDHSRVKISDQPDFFINACYIDGYAKQNEYIASLGPTGKVTYAFKTFWLMVWNERSDIIVMLTNLREPSGMKCEQYWPELGTTATYGVIQVTFEKEDAFAEYTTRSFTVSSAEEKRIVTHLHYTAWPDKKVPEDVTTLIEFRQRIKITPSAKKGPIIVHCSAGIGRTGTLIALDRLIQEGQCESSVDVFKCVNSMREQRVKMVQTLEQYIYIYKALVNSLYFDSEEIPIESFQEYVDQTNNNIYSRQFQQLKDSVEECGKEEHDARARNKMLADKNQNDADIPGNQYRVYLYQNRSMDNSDYINAVYVSSFKKKDHFIIAQSPLPGTVSDFVCMMYQENCCCVVTMEDLNKPGMSVGHYLPTEGQSQRFGDIKISSRTLETSPQYTVREIKMQNYGKFESQEKVAYHFQYNKWVQGNDTPADTKGFVQFIKNVEDYADQLGGEDSHVLVHCLKANERSALYSIVTILTEKIKYERQVSVLNTVRHLRTRRRTAITSMEQLKFCYKALQAYIDMFES